MASDHRMLQAGDQSFLQKTAGVRLKKCGAFQRKQGASCCTESVKSIMYLVLNGASSKLQRQDPNSPLTCRAFFPQEQGMKANNSKELSMCFTEVSRGIVGDGYLRLAHRKCYLGES